MSEDKARYAPGRVRDGIVQVMSLTSRALSVKEIEERVSQVVGPTRGSSVRSYLRLNTPEMFTREERGVYTLRSDASSGIQSELSQGRWKTPFSFGRATLHHSDCFDWLSQRDERSIHAVVTDPPYGLHEYSSEQQAKLRRRKGGVWRMPPSFDGHLRSPLPRFTTLTSEQLGYIRTFFFVWGRLLIPKLVPGANVVVASNPLVSHLVSSALADAGLERRGEIVRLTMTLRGGDRPKAAQDEFPEVSVMPRSMWEPWVVFRRPIEGRVQDNLRKWNTGGFRRPREDKPFGDVIPSSPTRKAERDLAPHPSLKPQSFLRQLVRSVLPVGEGSFSIPSRAQARRWPPRRPWATPASAWRRTNCTSTWPARRSQSWSAIRRTGVGRRGRPSCSSAYESRPCAASLCACQAPRAGSCESRRW